MVGVNYRKIPGLGLVKLLCGHLERVSCSQYCGRFFHERNYFIAAVEFLAEHDIAHGIKTDDALQMTSWVNYGEYVAVCLGDDVYECSKIHIGGDGTVIALDERLHVEEG